MKLSAMQTAVAVALALHPDLDSLPVVLDDGTGEANKDRIAALKSQGLCLLVWRPEGGSTVSTSRTGALVCEVLLFVFIEENLSVNRVAGGTGVHAADAAEYVMAALSGARFGAERLTLDSPPFDNLGTVNGVSRFLVSAVLQLPVVPLAP